VEHLVIAEIEKLATMSKLDLEQIIGKSRSSQDEISALETALAKIEKRMQKQIEAFENDLISAHDLKLARERIELERSHTQQSLDDLKNKEVNVDLLKDNITKQLQDITGADRVKAKKSMPLLIEQIIVENQNIEIVWRF
jgi:site-specific DNA recombinase